jgi:hypothetical protein
MAREATGMWSRWSIAVLAVSNCSDARFCSEAVLSPEDAAGDTGATGRLVTILVDVAIS